MDGKRLSKDALILFLFLIPTLCFSQNGKQTTWRSSQAVVDSTGTTSLYLNFQSPLGDDGFGTSYSRPKQVISITNDLLVTGQVDSLKASHNSDSLTIYFVPFDRFGNVIPDTLFFDFTNNDTTSAKQYIDWTPYNQAAKTAGTDAATFWVDLSGNLRDYPGGKFVIEQVSTTATTDSTGVILIVAQGHD